MSLAALYADGGNRAGVNALRDALIAATKPVKPADLPYSRIANPNE